MSKFGRELQKIHNREDLAKSAPLLKLKFDRLVDLMIEARKTQQDHPEECVFDFDHSIYSSSEAVKEQLKRVYRIEGGKDVIEKAQREALIRLDAFERILKKTARIRV